MAEFPILKWLTVDGQSVPFTYPQHKKSDGSYVETGEDNPLPVANYGMTEGGVWIPQRVNDDGSVNTRVTGSNVEEERISISDLDVDEREEYRITPPENAVYKILNVSFDLRPNDKLRFRMFVGSASRDRRVFEISTTKNISCFTNYLDVDFDDVIIGARNELEGYEMFKNLYATNNFAIGFEVINEGKSIESDRKNIRIVYEVIR